MNRVNLRMVIPIQIGIMALLLGGYLLFGGTSDSETKPTVKPDPPAQQTVKTVKTVPLVVKKGGFRLGVPTGLTAKRTGRTVTLSAKDRALVVTAGPVAAGSLTAGSKAFVTLMKRNYTTVRVLGTDRRTVNGRPALTTYGQAVNAKKVRVRFVSVLVSAKAHNFAINSFAGFASDPEVVLPQVNAVVSSFAVLR